MRAQIWDYPPYPYLAQVLNHCCKAAGTYLDLWKVRDKENKILVEKDDIRMRFLTSTHHFNHNVLLLAREGLASIQETPTHLSIELTDWDDGEFDD
ncbi:MAG TPA: hypothetical protein VKZ95_01325 [Sphingobacteriaceae bacterium]|nr:hypothetical protein [Sphingobacteriaceae bacterium]